jgi:hypothetical protein
MPTVDLLKLPGALQIAFALAPSSGAVVTCLIERDDAAIADQAPVYTANG